MTHIIATIGKACHRRSILLEMAHAGMTITRINFSHENLVTHSERVKLIRKLNETASNLKIFLDLQGPEVRLWNMEKPVPLKKDEEVLLSGSPGKGIRISNPGFLKKLDTGSKVLIDDGYVELVVTEKTKDGIRCKALSDCTLKPRKSVASEFVSMEDGAVTDNDRDAISFGLEREVDYIGLSHAKNATDVIEAQELAGEIPVFAKIENCEAVNNIKEIIEVSNGIVIARGDLGINMPLVMTPLLQEHLLLLSKKAGKPAIVATQMMESMISNSRPSRAEVNDVYTAVRQGAWSVWLSGETAIGNYPVESVRYMKKIIKVAESKNVMNLERIDSNIMD